MGLKMVGKYDNDIAFEITSGEIDEHMKSGYEIRCIKLTEYLLDEMGKTCGIKAIADKGHGYGFDYGHEEFTLKIGETYSFDHSYTSIEGPTDWYQCTTRITLQLVETEE